MFRALALSLVLLMSSSTVYSKDNDILCSEAAGISRAARKQIALQIKVIKEKMATEEGMSFEEFVIRQTIASSLKELAIEMERLIDTDCTEA